MFDLLIKNASVVDGTGRVAFDGDIAVADGWIVEIGAVDGPATETLDVEGRTVAPGFIDLHTHYDAQVIWDPWLTPSCLHGVTTVIAGNCGFTMAPMTRAAFNDVVNLLGLVEAIPPAALKAGIDLDWGSFAEYLARLDNHVAINFGSLVGHSTLRRIVMGPRAEEPATDDDIVAMAALLDRSLAEGGLGFSSSWGELHTGAPSLAADEKELLALCEVVSKHPGTTVEFIPSTLPMTAPERQELMARMSIAADRPLNWNLISVRPDMPEEVLQHRLGGWNVAAERGAEVYGLALPMPTQIRHNFISGFLLGQLDGLRQIYEVDEKSRVNVLRDSSVRYRAQAAADGDNRTWARLRTLTVESVRSESLQDVVGRTVGDLADERRVRPIDVMFDLGIADDLGVVFVTPPMANDDAGWARRAEILQDPRVIVGGSDAGAHLDLLTAFAMHTTLLGEGVRDRGLLKLEDAVRMITSEPARFYGLRDRGVIRPGAKADFVIFDPATIGTGRIEFRPDFPDGVSRLYAEAVGIDKVIVAGRVVVDQGTVTDQLAGTVLRSGRDTETVEKFARF